MKQENNSRQFDLETVLTVTTHILLTNMGSVHDALNYLTGEDLYSHQLPRALGVASNYVLGLYPQLGEVNIVGGQMSSAAEVKKFTDEQKAKYGDILSLSPMPKGMYEAMNPLDELVKMKFR